MKKNFLLLQTEILPHRFTEFTVEFVDALDAFLKSKNSCIPKLATDTALDPISLDLFWDGLIISIDDDRIYIAGQVFDNVHDAINLCKQLKPDF